MGRSKAVTVDGVLKACPLLGRYNTTRYEFSKEDTGFGDKS